MVIQGTLEASQPLNTSLSFYVRTQNPQEDPGCTDLSLAYACNTGPNDEKAGEAHFVNTQSTALSLSGQNLTQGIAQGRFWLGLEVQGLPSGMVTFTLKNAKATVTVGL